MLASDGVRAVAQGASAALLLTGHAQVWELIVLQALYGSAAGFFAPAATAVVPQTVDERDLQQANALLGLTDSVSALVGPAVAGVLVATLGPGWGLAIDAMTFVASAAFLSRLHVAATTPPARRGTFDELRAGLRTFRAHTWVWVVAGFFSLYLAFGYAPEQVLGPAVARHWLGGAARGPQFSSRAGWAPSRVGAGPAMAPAPPAARRVSLLPHRHARAGRGARGPRAARADRRAGDRSTVSPVRSSTPSGRRRSSARSRPPSSRGSPPGTTSARSRSSLWASPRADRSPWPSACRPRCTAPARSRWCSSSPCSPSQAVRNFTLRAAARLRGRPEPRAWWRPPSARLREIAARDPRRGDRRGAARAP